MRSESAEDRGRRPAGDDAPPGQADPGPDAPAGSIPPGPGDNEDPATLLTEDGIRGLRGDEDLRGWDRLAEILGQRMYRTNARAHNLNVFNGSFTVGGDASIGGSASRVDEGGGPEGPRRLHAAYVLAYTGSYVEPTGFQQALDVLADHHLVVIAGNPCTGRGTAALQLLRRLLQPTDVDSNGLYDLPLAVALQQRGLSELPPGCGYLMYVTSWSGPIGPSEDGASASAALDDAWLARASAELAGVGSYLVVVTPPLSGALSDAVGRAAYVVERLGTPAPEDVVRRLVLDAVENADDELISRVLSHETVAAEIRERTDPASAARVGRAVADALRSGRDINETLAELVDPSARVRQWFDDHREPDQLAFAVSAAVLEDATYLSLSDAAVALYRSLADESHPPSTSVRFRSRLAEDHAWLELVATERPAWPGARVSEHVRFRRPELQLAVLHHAWFELDGLRPTVGSWLEDLAAHPDVEVRARAAASTGLLAAGDFSYAVTTLLRPWGGSTSPLLRQSAAGALGVVAGVGASQDSETNPPHEEAVWALLEEWAGGGPERLRSTAAVAVRSALGERDRHRALCLLRQVLELGTWASVGPAWVSLRDILDRGSFDVVEALLEWTGAVDDAPLTAKALVVFNLLLRETGDTGDGRTEWPLLLLDPLMPVHGIAELLGRALARREMRPVFLESLRGWVDIVDEDWLTYRKVADLLEALADRSERDAERVLFHLESWADDPARPSSAAGLLLEELFSPDTSEV